MHLDEKDIKILEFLEENSKHNMKQLSKLLKIPPTTVYHRIKQLEQEGIIKGYTIKVDNIKLGKAISAFILITVAYHGKKFSQREIAEKIKQRKEVESINIITGEKDIIIKIRTPTITQLNHFITDHLRNIEGIDKTDTMIVLEEIE
jgi:DNA-binding Lrp family transcriptional regulator